MTMNISDFISAHNITEEIEGNVHSMPEMMDDLTRLTSGDGLRVMEIGFNAGHSSDAFLSRNPTLLLTSFDIGDHRYVPLMKQYIDNSYPGRHVLVLGDSAHSVPAYTKQYGDTKFDVIFIDGGHAYETAKTDIVNCSHLAHKDTIVILDDTIYTKGWERDCTLGPTRAWKECIDQGIIAPMGSKDYCYGRGISWGKYIRS